VGRKDVSRPDDVDVGFASHVKAILEVFRRGPERAVLLWLGADLVLVIGATAYGQIKLNAWNQPFYDALARKDFADFGRQLFVFSLIAGALLILNVIQTWLNQMTKLKLREGLTQDLFEQWLTPRRAFLLAGSGEIGVNPDQRIHADAQRLAEISTDLGVGLLQATLLLLSFTSVLWTLSAGVAFQIGERSFDVPGYMVWSALFYAGAASAASWRVGRPLIELNAERYARESDIRFALVHVNEHSEGIAVYRGEAEEKAHLRREFDRLVVVLRRLVGATTNLTWVTAGYGWFTIVAPIIVAAPAYYAGNLSFGGLLMAAGAFTQVQQSLRWFVDNAGAIADWRATLFRVGSFRLALLEIDQMGEEASRIQLRTLAIDKIIFDNLRILSPTGASTLSEAHIEIAPSERVLIAGAPASGKTSLFRAIAGLWPWGGGSVSLPDAHEIIFMPKRPYLPDGAIRDILAYPASPNAFTDEQFGSALTRMGLSHLFEGLDRAVQWDKELTDPEQQALAFARILLHRPRWVIVDEAIGALSQEARKAFFEALDLELAGTALLHIGGLQAEDKIYGRILRLTKSPQGGFLKVPSKT
jgi:vitamin B12/bleomycin/antimicrobial peptide transport system ATP-binding/permease protein